MFIWTPLLIRGAYKSRITTIKILLISLSVLPPVLLFTFRSGIGTDYYNYLQIFESSSRFGESRIEYGYLAINIFIKFINGNFQLLSLVMITTIFIFILKTIAYYDLSSSMMIFIYLIFFYQISMNITRQAIAMSLVMYSYKYLEKRDFWKYSGYILISCLFHYSSLIMFPVFFIFPHLVLSKKNIRNILILIFSVLLISVNFEEIINLFFKIPQLSTYRRYLEVPAENPDFGYLIRYSPILAISFYLHLMNEIETRYSKYEALFIINLLLKSTIFLGSQFLSRIALYFELSLIILIPYYFKKLSNKKNYILWIFLFVYLLVNWLFVYILKNNHGTYPYRTISQSLNTLL